MPFVLKAHIVAVGFDVKFYSFKDTQIIYKRASALSLLLLF